MSKNYTNYSKPKESKMQDEAIQATEDTANTVVDPDPAQVPVDTTPAVVELDPEQAPVATVVPEDDEQTSTSDPEPDPEAIIGVVSNCKMLNVRAKPDKKSEIISIINAGDEVEIIEEGSTEDFYHIYYVTSKDINVFGYCMKDFITIK